MGAMLSYCFQRKAVGESYTAPVQKRGLPEAGNYLTGKGVGT